MSRSLFWSKVWIRTRLAGLFPSVRRLVGGETESLRYYSDRVLTAPVEAMLDPALFPPPAGSHVIDLNLAAPRFDTATSLNRLAVDRGGLSPGRGLRELREAIADDRLRSDGVTVDPAEQVLVTHGATGAYAAALDAFVNPDDRVVLLDPCSPLFALGASSRRARTTWVQTWNDEGRLGFHPAAMRRALRGAKMLVLCDPCNPTGACLEFDDLEQIAKLAAKYDVLIYRDETFGRFRYDNECRAIETLPSAASRTITAGSATASLGLGAVRVGWLTGPRGLVNGCAVAANLSAPFVPAVCQQLAARSLRESDDRSFAAVREEFHHKRQFAFDRLEAIGLEPDWPAGGYFLWVNVAMSGMTGREFAEQLYARQQVLVAPGDLYSPKGGEFVRISFAIEDGRLREGLSRIAAYVKGEPTQPMPEVEVEERAEPRFSFSDVRKPAFSRA